MKTAIIIAFLFLFSVPEKNNEIITPQDHLKIDGEIHKENIIKSVEDFLNELGLDTDTFYIPFTKKGLDII